jgi:hypothetical protein
MLSVEEWIDHVALCCVALRTCQVRCVSWGSRNEQCIFIAKGSRSFTCFGAE